MEPEDRTDGQPKMRRAAIDDFKPVVGTRPAEEISFQIRERIAAHTLQTGDRLPSERELSAQFQVSRNTLRQALRSLADGGLLEMRKGSMGGAFVVEGGSDAVLNAFTDLCNLGTISLGHLTEVRVLVTVEVARVACARGTLEEIHELETNVEHSEEAVRGGDLERRRELNLEFYRILGRMTHNPLLVTLTNVVTALTLQFVRGFAPAPSKFVMPIRRQILTCVRKRSGEQAAEAMREYLQQLQRRLLQQQ